MLDKLRNDLLDYLKKKGERGATLSTITLDLGSRIIEDTVEKSVNEIAAAMNSLIEDQLIEINKERLYDSADTVYKLKRFHKGADV